MTIMSKHQGFMTEVKSRKWIYKGEQFMRLPLIKLSAFKEFFLTDLSLMQMMTVASQRPADAIETLIANYGTDNWLKVFIQHVTAEQSYFDDQPAQGTAGHSLNATVFSEVPRFDVMKMSSQVR